MLKKTHIIYILLVVLATAALVGYLTYLDRATIAAHWPGILFFALLSVLAESQSLAIDDEKAISVSFSVNISTLLLFGLAPAAWVSFCTAVFAVTDYGRGRREHLLNIPFYKTAFNAANYILSILATGFVYQLLGGSFLVRQVPAEFLQTAYYLTDQLPAIFAGVVAYVFVNTFSIMLYFASSGAQRSNLLRQWLGIIRWSLLSMICIGALGVLITILHHSFGFWSVLVIFTPFLMLRYTFAGFTSIQKSYLQTIRAFSAALEAKDKSTQGHALRVGRYCELIGQELKLSADRMKVLKYGSLLHDIGKIGIPETILNKKDKLTPEEMEQMRQHPLIGAQMMEGISFLKDEVRIIRGHHIHFDGSGYPPGAQQDAKLLETRILSVADAFDAMTSIRSYRRQLSLEDAFSELRRCSGSQFDPQIVEALIRAVGKLPDGIASIATAK